MSGECVRIAMWSGPRNISTAMMRAFANRADTAVWDEPFYACYLEKTGLDHPMAADIIAAYETDWRVLVGQLTGPAPGGASVFYQKHMCHHMLPEIGLEWLAAVRNCFLIREPARVLASYAAKRDMVTLEDLGFPQQRTLFERVRADLGAVPPVLDCDDILADPRAMLKRLCEAVGIAFDKAMLSWPAGRHDSDGLWAAHWYGAVEASTGFAPPPAAPAVVPAHLVEIVEAAQPIYDELWRHRLTAEGSK
jgi:hypothetical protein